jgi:hypothetical protein
MALRKKITLSGDTMFYTSFGVVNTGASSLEVNAYIKVKSVHGGKEAVTASVEFSDGQMALQKQFVFAPDLDGPNFIKQAYEHLKTLPEFDGAIDC